MSNINPEDLKKQFLDNIEKYVEKCDGSDTTIPFLKRNRNFNKLFCYKINWSVFI